MQDKTKPPQDDIKTESTISIVDEMKKSYLDYAMSVIVSRALPDVRDGLKPVHRRLLYTMKIGGYSSDKAYRKSARIVGDVMGRFHPHGDQAIYFTLTRLAQDFSMRLPLIDGQGNFGSLDRDPPASMRYTEARLSKAAETILEEVDFDTVDMQPNYDGSEIEPKVLPSRFPNLLVNGQEGIAVGMSTSIPPHNLEEVINATIALLENPDLTTAELMTHMPGPDFPTGGMIVGSERLLNAYETGHGVIYLRGCASIEEHNRKRQRIIISEIPYQVNKAALHERIGECAREKLIEGITDARDLSNREGVRLVVEVSSSASAEVILNQLYRLTPLQISFGINLLALENNRPRVMGLKEILNSFLSFREEVTTRRKRYELKKATERAHIVIGLLVAQINLDKIIPLIRSSANAKAARETLMQEKWNQDKVAEVITLIERSPKDASIAYYTLSENQARAILEMPLQRLTALEHEKLMVEARELAGNITTLREILANRSLVLALITDDLRSIAKKFGKERLTKITRGSQSIDDIELIQPEKMVIMITRQGFIKRVALSTYVAQGRGGKGRSGMETRDDDEVTRVLISNTRDFLLFFTDDGKVYSSPVHTLPLGSPKSKGRSINNFLNLDNNRQISTILTLTRDRDTDNYLMFSTSSGNIRRNHFSDFASIQSSGKIAMRLEVSDSLVKVAECNENDHIIIATKKGMAVKFNATDVRIFAGRASIGVRGVKLAKDDKLISMSVLPGIQIPVEKKDDYLAGASLNRRSAKHKLTADEKVALEKWQNNEEYKGYAENEKFILVVTGKGYGKLSSMYDYRLTKRGGKGIMNIAKVAGDVVITMPVVLSDELIIVTDGGQIIRIRASDIRIMSRGTKGVRIINTASDESVVSVDCISKDDEYPTEEAETEQ